MRMYHEKDARANTATLRSCVSQPEDDYGDQRYGDCPEVYVINDKRSLRRSTGRLRNFRRSRATAAGGAAIVEVWGLH